MSGAFVVDASVAFSWVYPDQSSAYTERVLAKLEEGASLVVPTIWPLEISNAILVAVRRRRMTDAEAKSAFEFLKCLAVTIDADGPLLAFGRTQELAQLHTLSAYDACYLELAIRKTLAIATRDEPLIKAAAKSGVEIFNPS
jgi:predicted nucleic acid-binding protein